jgi:dTDP-4-amino-4,6-dideoxygalactose transaminase
VKQDKDKISAEYAAWPSFSEEERAAVSSVLSSGKVNYWTGDECKAFEEEFAAYVNCEHAVALANGTLALELALRVLDIGPGDEVIVSPRTFIASASSIVSVGAKPVFADVDPDSQNITATTIEKHITRNTRAIICVHLAGWPCDMTPIRELADKHSLRIVEDCAQAHGAQYLGRPVGSLGDVAAWSFCQDKIMSTGGEGGMLTTNDKNLWERAWSYKDHGKARNIACSGDHTRGFRWLHESFGTNWRLTEMQAAIGRIQLRNMPAWHMARKRNAEAILDVCANWEDILRVPRPPAFAEHAWYKCYVFVNPEALAEGWSRDRVIDEISRRGIPCFSGSCPEVYLEKAFDRPGFRPYTRLPVARRLGETSLMFLVHPTLSMDAVGAACEVITEVMNKAQNSR